MTLFDVFLWLNDTAIGVAVRDSLWLFPAIQVVHLLSLASLGGAVLAVDLRVLGVALRGIPVEALAEDLSWGMTGSLVVITVTGVGMFLSEALRMYDNAAFWVKIVTFVVAVVFTYVVRPKWLTEKAARQRAARGARRGGGLDRAVDTRRCGWSRYRVLVNGVLGRRPCRTGAASSRRSTVHVTLDRSRFERPSSR